MDEQNNKNPQSKSWLFGILAVLPIILLVKLLINFFTRALPELIRLTESGEHISAGDILQLLSPFITMAILFGLLHFFLLIWFIIHLMQDKTTTQTDRIVWLLLLIFLNPFSFPFYWYFRMYKPVAMRS